MMFDTWLRISDTCRNIDEFCAFVGSIEAYGGGDTAEDVFGGLKAMLKCDWHENAGTKVRPYLSIPIEYTI